MKPRKTRFHPLKFLLKDSEKLTSSERRIQILLRTIVLLVFSPVIFYFLLVAIYLFLHSYSSSLADNFGSAVMQFLPLNDRVKEAFLNDPSLSYLVFGGPLIIFLVFVIFSKDNRKS